MQWQKVEVEVGREHVSAVEAVLSSRGALSITLTDPADVPVLEPGVGETPMWPAVVVTALFEDLKDRGRLQMQLELVSGAGARSPVRYTLLEDRDWERERTNSLEPMSFGNDLWIVPEGQKPPDPSATVVFMDPGLAFGSGAHPTTRLCLEWIGERQMEGCTFIDYGCGSGVLGIAAARKGAARVVCVDNDPQALEATMENAVRNGVSGRIEALRPNLLTAKRADFLVANILAGTLVELAARLCGLLKPGGGIALSGILPEQVQDVSSTYARRLDGIQRRTLDDWALIHGVKKQA